MNISKQKILAIIPARGGSKGIPKKNIHLLGGKPLLAWTVEASLKSKLINRTVVSSDSKEILEVAKNFGAEAIRRPKKISGDHSPFNLLIFHVLNYLKKNDYFPDIIVYLQPTSPLRSSKDIDQSIELFKKNPGGVISVYEEDNKIFKSFIIKGNFLKPAFNERWAFANRQSLPRIYMPNGAIYIVKTKSFLKNGSLFSEKTAPFVMSKEKSCDVDTFNDLVKIERILKAKKHRIK